MRRPLRPLAHRPPARRQRADGALQLAARPRARVGRSSSASRTPTSSARRGSRRRASSRTCAGWVSTGTRASRWAARWGRIGSRSASTSIARIPMTLARFRARAIAASARPRSWRPSARRNWRRGSRRATPARAAAWTRRTSARRQAAGEPAVVRLRVPANREVVFEDLVRGTGGLPHRPDRRPGARAVRRYPRLQLRGGHRRPADGRHARDPRRGPHLEHAAPGARVRGLRLDAAGVRAPLAGAGARPRAAFETARSHLGRGVPCPGAICPRRW